MQIRPTFSGCQGNTPDDRTTEYTYDGNSNLTALKAWLTDLAFQETRWIYGVTTTGDDPSDLNSNDLVKEVWHPNKTTGVASASEKESLAYNALGQRRFWRDRNTTVHRYTFDVMGRLTKDGVETLGTGISGTVRRLETAYDQAGRPYLFTSFSGYTSGAMLNQVSRTFNGVGQLRYEYQCHDGGVGICTGGDLSVEYRYSEMAGGANHSRLTKVVYPTTSRELNYQYTATLDNTISRLTSLLVNAEAQALESYTYLGLGTVVERNHPEPSVHLTYLKQSGEANGDAGDQYTGLDRFGRVVDQRWRKGDGTHTDRFGYGYDRNSNRLYRQNALQADQSEVYHTGGASGGYDKLNQLTGFKRGTLNDVKDDVTEAPPPRSQGWGFDALGNWLTFTTDTTTQTRTHNAQNQILTISGATNPVYDLSGNLTKDEGNRDFVYDAWNRLVSATYSAGTVTFKYDALGRRIQETLGGTTRDFYYSAGWQVLEERVSGQANPYFYAWSPVYVDALVARDEGSTRLYVQQDANFNVTALVDTTGTVVERFKYDPYGLPIFMNGSWTGLDASGYNWVYLHQGGRYFRFATVAANEAGLYHFRNRELSATLGRWMQVDPIGFRAGDANLYRVEQNNPGTLLDPSGLLVLDSVTASARTASGRAIIAETIGLGLGLGLGVAVNVTNVGPGNPISMATAAALRDAVPPVGPRDLFPPPPPQRPRLRRDEPSKDYCFELYQACLLTKLADLCGRVYGESRCQQCLFSCIAAGGRWRGWYVSGLTGKRFRCDYWNFTSGGIADAL